MAIPVNKAIVGKEYPPYTVTVEALTPRSPKVQMRFRVEVTADQLERGKPLLTEEPVTVTGPQAPPMPPP